MDTTAKYSSLSHSLSNIALAGESQLLREIWSQKLMLCIMNNGKSKSLVQLLEFFRAKDYADPQTTYYRLTFISLYLSSPMLFRLHDGLLQPSLLFWFLRTKFRLTPG